MRPFKMALTLCALLMLMVPTPANAWFGWLDYLSGPGRFRGPQFEFRLVCFGDESEGKRLLDTLANANYVTTKIVNGDANSLENSLKATDAAWEELIRVLSTVQLTFPVVDAGDIGSVSGKLRENLRALRSKVPLKVTPEGITDSVNAFLADQNREVQPVFATVLRGISAIGSTGVFLSACSTDKKRRSSIELGANFWYADAKKEFANNEQIRLTTLMPFFSFRLFTDPRFDFLDAGVGAGIYWFTSKGFESFSGVVLQPGRFDFHAPTVWSTYDLKGWKNVLRRVAAAPTFRVDWMIFPAGFSPDAFAGIGDRHVRIPAELTGSWALFINIEPFVRKAPFVGKPKAAGTR